MGFISSLFGGGGGADDPGRERRNLSGNQHTLYMEQQRNADLLTGQNDNQRSFANQLAEKALGQGPSIANMQMKAAQDRNLAQQLALAKSVNRGANPNLAARSARMNAAQTNQGIAQQGAIAGLQEQMANQAQYQSYLQGQQQNFGNLSGLRTQALTGAAGVQQGQQQQDNALIGGLLGTAGQIGAAMAMPAAIISDKREKTKIKSEIYKSVSDENEKKEVSIAKNSESMNPKHFLDALQAYSYEYKNPEKPGAGDKRYLGIMAQDLEKAGPAGKALVNTQQDGTKIVDMGKGFGTILAAQAHLNERLKELESKKKRG